MKTEDASCIKEKIVTFCVTQEGRINESPCVWLRTSIYDALIKNNAMITCIFQSHCLDKKIIESMMFCYNTQLNELKMQLCCFMHLTCG